MLSIEYLRQFRIGQYAVFDFAITFIGFYLLAPLLSKLFRKLKIEIPKRNWLFLALPIGFLTHLLFGRITPMTANLLDLHAHYLLKLVMLALLVLGLKDIKRVKK